MSGALSGVNGYGGGSAGAVAELRFAMSAMPVAMRLIQAMTGS